MPDLSNNRFAENPINLDIQRSIFNMPHSVKFTGNVGELLVFENFEVLPGDTISIDTSKVVRMQPLVTPIMDDVFLDTYYFFVPTRLIWNHWKAFWGENELGPWYPSVEYTVPQLQIPSGGFDVGTIADYFGIPPKAGAGKKISALPFRAYAKICDDWFRDENLMNPVNVSVGDSDVVGVNTGDQVTDIQLGGKPFIVCKYFDYFTACLPGAQKAAGPTVEFALRGLLPVNAYKSKTNMEIGEAYDSIGGMTMVKEFGTSTAYPGSNSTLGVNGSNGGVFNTSTSASSSNYLTPSNLFAKLNNINVFSINELREAFAVQRYYEKLARGGSRYIEFIKSFFNVDSPDARLQRSEYLGGNRLPLNVSQVEQTSASQTGLTPQGNLTGISHTGEVHSDFTKSFTEHGYIIGVCVARYHHSYQQSVERTWFRKTKFDYYNPTFANLGEQGVFEKEIYFNNTDNVDVPNIFGYQEAWADYRYKPNRVAGEMRSVATTPLDMWHLADNYSSVPYLSDSWIREDKTMLDRCLAVTSSVSNQLIFDFYFLRHFQIRIIFIDSKCRIKKCPAAKTTVINYYPYLS